MPTPSNPPALWSVACAPRSFRIGHSLAGPAVCAVLGVLLALPPTAWAADGAGAPSAAAGVEARAPEEYRLGAGDVLRIAVYQNPDLSLESRLSEAGVLNFPLLGPVRLGGLTVGAAEQLLARGLREGQFVRQPQVNVSVVQVRGHQAACWAWSTAQAGSHWKPRVCA